uniref:Uncharacterized protein n=1 Tax=Ananas comosus var. bracteatus TaxID=296719 RepID=A0A6V7PJT8_ANACO|nr:unnamed protein product [Ananas comosus var. bracteatus]
MSAPERESIDYDLLKALRRGDEGFVRKFFAEDSVLGGHAVDVERPDAENVTDGARICRSWQGVTTGGNSALHIVAGFGHLELAKFICDKDRSLLAAGARYSSLLTARNEARETPLHCAARAGSGRIVSHFISVLAADSRRSEELLRAKDGREDCPVRGGRRRPCSGGKSFDGEGS